MASKQIFLAAMTLMFLAVGCNQKGADNSASISARTASRGSALTTATGGAAFYSNTSGTVFSDPSYSDAFSGAIRRLVTASVDEQYVGTVAAQGAVILTGYIEIDSSGNLVTGKSVMSLKIHDSYSGQTQDNQVIPDLIITLPATTGRVYNGQATLTFGDSYGTITLVGSFPTGNTSGSFTGQMSFANTNGGSGSGLSFQIATCGFFRCN